VGSLGELRPAALLLQLAGSEDLVLLDGVDAGTLADLGLELVDLLGDVVAGRGRVERLRPAEPQHGPEARPVP
jgi:hypothetical protein